MVLPFLYFSGIGWTEFLHILLLTFLINLNILLTKQVPFYQIYVPGSCLHQMGENEMKKMLVLLVMALVAFMLSGCSMKKYCTIDPPSNEVTEKSVGSIMIKKIECFGRVTVDNCDQTTELLYLGRTHPGNYIRITSRVGRRTPVVAEVTYPENSKVIDFGDAKIEIIESNDNFIRFKLIRMSVEGCDRINGRDVKIVR